MNILYCNNNLTGILVFSYTPNKYLHKYQTIKNQNSKQYYNCKFVNYFQNRFPERSN